jgi:hypothetical protein
MNELAFAPSCRPAWASEEMLGAAEPLPDESGRFGVVRPLPVIELGDRAELQVAPLEYASIASRPEPVRVI